METVIDREYEKRTVSEEGSVITIDSEPVRSYTLEKTITL